MAETAGNLTSELLIRVRDPQGSIRNRVFARDILDRCQKIINASQALVIASQSFALEQSRLVYDVSGTITDLVEVRAVRWQDRDLDETTLTELKGYSRTWFRDTADDPLAFARVGRDLLIIYPAPNAVINVDVIYTKLTTDFTAESIAIELSADNVDIMLDLAEIILLMQQRAFTPVADSIRRIGARLRIRRKVNDVIPARYA